MGIGVLATVLALLVGSGADDEIKLSQPCDYSLTNDTIYQFSQKSIDNGRPIRMSSYLNKVLSF